MRLGQLARQLAISPDELVNYLTTREIALDSHPNTRLEDKHVEMILQHFAPGDEVVRQQVQELLPESSEPLQAEATGEPTPPEIIRAPKVELPGLRVIGKIDLPEKKKPEPKQEDPAAPKVEGTVESPKPEVPKQKDPKRAPAPDYVRRSQPPRDRTNPIALAREREERERKRKLEEAREKEKERRAEFYRKRLKPQAPTKAVRIVREEYEEMPALEPEKPKTAWGRFMHWLKT